MFSCGVYEILKNWCLRTSASETCCFTWSVLKWSQIGTWLSLREKCPNTKFCLVRIFPYSDWILRDTLYLSVFNPNVGKCGPEKTPYLDTFHTVVCIIIYSFTCLSPFIINTIDTAIIRSSRLVVFCKKVVLTNFANLTRKHLP